MNFDVNKFLKNGPNNLMWSRIYGNLGFILSYSSNHAILQIKNFPEKVIDKIKSPFIEWRVRMGAGKFTICVNAVN